jgi:anti-sigma regulatory factor (Ser/Thr protein kinase)
MAVEVGHGPRPELRVRLAAETASVPGARRFVCDGLADWGRPALVDDAALCVTEMAANAALHSGSRFMDVILHDLAGPVRVAVEDEGAAVPVEAVRPAVAPAVDDDSDAWSLDEQPTTGRGLAIVSMIAESWGVEETPHGRVIWADLGATQGQHAVRPPQVVRTTEREPADAVLPADWKTTRMLQCPVRLALRLDHHLDDLVRELQLMAGSRTSPPPARIARLNDYLARAAFARHTGRRIAQEAAAAGLEHVDIEMAMPRSMSSGVRDLDAYAHEADEVCREYGLLTQASTAEMESLRTWFTECMAGQLEHAAAPITYADWLAARA